MEDLPLRTADLVPEFAVKDLPLDRILMMMMMMMMMYKLYTLIVYSRYGHSRGYRNDT